MIDTTKAKADAEEGLRIAEKATDGPWGEKCGTFKHYCFSTEPGEAFGFSAQEMHWEDGRDVPAHENCVFVADSRTRAPAAYHNVIALAEEVERLRAEVARCGKLELYNLRIGSRRLSDLIAMQEKVTALEAEVARMKPLIAATFAWVETEGIDGDNALLDAVNSYETSPTP